MEATTEYLNLPLPKLADVRPDLVIQHSNEQLCADIEACKALIADLRALVVKVDDIAYRAGSELNDGADYIGSQIERALSMANLTLRTLESDDTADQKRAAVELRLLDVVA